MSSFKEYFTYDCISFTIISLIYALLVEINVFQHITAGVLLQLFAMTTCAVTLMYFTNLRFSNTIFQMILVNLLDIFIAVFGLSVAFHMIDLTPVNILTVSIMILISYFGVFGVTIIRYQADADCINKRIKKFRDQEKEETHE
ncbi:MAG TPA: hypothetical protein VHP54_07970 [Caproiciproducens sp.]|nr:hypothetical protein [Caproiciproducens sp.]